MRYKTIKKIKFYIFLINSFNNNIRIIITDFDILLKKKKLISVFGLIKYKYFFYNLNKILFIYSIFLVIFFQSTLNISYSMGEEDIDIEDLEEINLTIKQKNAVCFIEGLVNNFFISELTGFPNKSLVSLPDDTGLHLSYLLPSDFWDQKQFIPKHLGCFFSELTVKLWLFQEQNEIFFDLLSGKNSISQKNKVFIES
jgi:hypothetical protein